MKSMRRLGLVLTVLFLGIIIGNFGIRPALLVFVPLFTLWFMLWMKRSTVNLSGAEFMKIISIMNPTTDPGNHNED